MFAEHKQRVLRHKGFGGFLYLLDACDKKMGFCILYR